MRNLLNETAPSRRRVISLTPLIDVVFILLIFLMLASNFTDYSSMSLKLPTTSGVKSGHVKLVRIDLLPDSGMRVNGKRIEDQSLPAILKKTGLETERLPILIYPATGVRIQRVIHLLDQLRKLGHANATMAGGRKAAP